MSARHQIAIGPIPTAEERAARHKRLFGPAKIINLARRPAEATQEPADAHVIAYREYLDQLAGAASPTAYLRFLCRLHSVSYDTIIGGSRACTVIAMKHRFIWEVKQKFPRLSMPQIGRVFGGMDHTSILHALRKGGQASPRNTQFTEREAHAKAMRAAGAELTEIAAELGCHKETVRYYLDPEYRARRREKNRRYGERHNKRAK